MTTLDEHFATEVAIEQVAAAAHAVDRERAFPAASLAALGAAGLLGLAVPEEHGGRGAGLRSLAEVCESVGGACASTGMTFLMHSVTAATVAAGGGVRAASILRALASGDALGTLAFSERGTGTHFHIPGLQARRGGDQQLRITGRKAFVTSGRHADVYLVLVRSEDGEGADCYAVDGSAPELSFEGRWDGVGMAGNASVAMLLNDVAVGEADRIGAVGSAGSLVFGVVAPWFLAGVAGVNIGIAAAAQRAATGHLLDRLYADGSSLTDVQAIQHALADVDLAVRQARLLLREAAALADDQHAEALVALMEAKIAATTTARTVTDRALEVCGGRGYTPALPIERHLRDARAGAVMAPTDGVLRTWIGKTLAGLPVP